MPLSEADIVTQGEGCSRGRYHVTEEDLDVIDKLLDKIDGENPYIVYKTDAIRKTMAGGSRASPGCLAYYLNRVMAEQEDLSKRGIYAHTFTDRVKGETGIRFDRNAPSRQEAEEPAGTNE